MSRSCTPLPALPAVSRTRTSLPPFLSNPNSATLPSVRSLAVPRSRRIRSPPGRGGDLILRDLGTAKDLTLGNVAEFGFDKKGGKLVLVLDTAGKAGNGVQLRDMKTGVLTQVESGKASYE